MGSKKDPDGAGVLAGGGTSAAGDTDYVTEGKGSLLTIKERLAMLDGAFPLDEAVVEGIWTPLPKLGLQLGSLEVICK